jgi:hypothetical protein
LNLEEIKTELEMRRNKRCEGRKYTPEKNEEDEQKKKEMR